MPSETPILKARIKTLSVVLTKNGDQETLKKELPEAEDNFEEALSDLNYELPEASLNRVTLARSLAELTDDLSIVKALTNNPDVTSLREAIA